MFHKGTILNWDSDSEYFFFKHYCDKNGDVRQKAKEYIESFEMGRLASLKSTQTAV